jgi:hypothetical protein
VRKGLSNGKYRDRPTGRYHSNCKRIRGGMTGPALLN